MPSIARLRNTPSLLLFCHDAQLYTEYTDLHYITNEHANLAEKNMFTKILKL